MAQIADLTEIELRQNGIPYTRNRTDFNVPERHLRDLVIAQMKANRDLMKRGVITRDMMKAELMKMGLVFDELISDFVIDSIFETALKQCDV